MNYEDCEELDAVDSLLTWNGKPRQVDIESLSRFGLATKAAVGWELTPEAEATRVRLRKAEHPERWKLCKKYMDQLASKRIELF